MKKCLNCSKPVYDEYCPHCGQKKSTHRFRFKSFMTTDFVQGILQLNGKFPYTIKSLLTRPGHSVREYIEGKRIVFFNGFSLLLILVAVNFIILEVNGATFSEFLKTLTQSSERGIVDLGGLIMANLKSLALLPILSMALASYLLFKKAKQNYFEHIVLNTYLSAGLMIFSLPVSILISIVGADIFVGTAILYLIQILMTGYHIWFLYQYFSVYEYSKASLIGKLIMTFFLYQFIIVMTALGVFAVLYFYDPALILPYVDLSNVQN